MGFSHKEYTQRKLENLVGGVVSGLVYDPDQMLWGLRIAFGDPAREPLHAWIFSDEEGNMAGWLEIVPVRVDIKE